MAEGITERLKKATQRRSMLKQAEISMRNTESLTLLNICEAFVMSATTYGIHLTPQDRELGETWPNLENDIIIYTMGTFFEARTNRLKDIA